MVCQVRLFVLSRLLSSLWVSRTGSASDWCALQEALYKFIDTIQYNTSISWIACNLSSMPLLGCYMCNRRKYDHVTPLLRDVLHCRLPVPLRGEFKICFLVYKSCHGAAPGVLRDYCKETYSSASGLRLRSTDKCDLLVRRMKTRFGDRAFSAAGPRCWNKLPAALRAANSIDSFKTGLKT